MRYMSSKRLPMTVTLTLAMFACFPAHARQAVKPPQHPASAPASNVVAWKALEAHTSAQPGVTVVLFHQRDKKDQPRLASLLKQADGSTVEIRVAKGTGSRCPSRGSECVLDAAY